jgi:hypothetical protein
LQLDIKGSGFIIIFLPLISENVYSGLCLENKLPLQDILVTMNIPMCNIVNYISDDEMIAGCTDRIGNEWINDNEWDEIYNINF